MTNEERDLITSFIQRVGGAQPGGGFAAQPGQPAPALPPIDPDADRLLADLFARFPEARYRITQMAFVQEHALVEATNRIQRLQWELQQAQQRQQAPGAAPWGQPQQQESRGFFGSLFGGARQAPPPPPQPQYAPPPPPPPQYAPGYSPGMFAPRGSGFLGSALTTAAGVAGGLVAGNALMNLFSGGHGGFGSVPAGGFIPTADAASPWAAPGGASPGVDPYDVGGAEKTEPDSSGWTTDQPAPDDSGWTDAGSAPDGQQAPDDSGWTDAGDSSFDGGSDSTDWT
jgi:hypothetical protein